LRGSAVTRTRPLLSALREDTVGGLIDRSPRLIVRDGPWKLLLNAETGHVELYNITVNSLEVDRLAARNPEAVLR
jgi:hypothetical protein